MASTAAQSLAKTRLPIVFGAMTIGKPGVEQTRIHSLDQASEVLDLFQEYGHSEIDTARVYGQGSSEEYLGRLDWQSRGLVMGTKFYANPTLRAQGVSHSPDNLRKFLKESLVALKTEKIDLWYLHAPDRSVPFEDTFRAVNDLYQEGLFRRFGISNYMSWEVARINEMCIQNGWVRPSVYQGVYNAIHRGVEPELFPCLRHYGMAFYAYNPLAGGSLTARYGNKKRENVPDQGSRFDPNTKQGTLYRKRYWNDTVFSAVTVVREAMTKHGLTEVQCALRWLEHHSKLQTSGDAIIVGASSAPQLEENLKALEQGPLPSDVVEALDQAWEITKRSSWNYFH
ncbi:NADP-dependent oxidoreductase domain-containing protein [Pestalotiopsis sp. NC0098]|nr:NADP-dependent oxidoreductase domain-containing protein [Pestalotiopsis sp. NC0098]